MERTAAVANYFIDMAKKAGCPDLTQMKLQKLTYFAHGYHLGNYETVLLPEPILAWRYGPVIYSLRQEFGRYGNDPIKGFCTDIIFDEETGFNEFFPQIELNISRSLLDKTWQVYGSFDGTQLANMTHKEGSPWHQVAAHYQFKIPDNIIIPTPLIQNYFKACIDKGVYA